MSKIYDNFLKNIKKYPKKIFIFDLKKKFSGAECYSYLKKTEKFIKLNKIRSIGIQGKNSFDWIILYLAADKYCSRTFVIKNNINSKSTEKLKKKYKIDFIGNKIPQKKNKISKTKNIMRKKTREDILFTSGTTDLSKGVIINKNSFIHVAKILIKELKQNKSDLELLSMPFDHSFGLVRLRCCLYSGSQMLVTNGLINFPDIYNFSKKYSITGLSLVPSGVELIKLLLKNKVNEFNKNMRYFEIGSSSLNRNTRIWLKKHFKKTNIIHHYGMTEASRSFLIKRGNQDNLRMQNNIIGKIIKGCEYKIDYNTKKTRGELLLKGKNLFLGYLNIEENNKKFVKDWFKTGDICEKKGNNIKLVGRIDNQFNIGGNKIQAEFVENQIEKISFVKKCLCFQVNDRFFEKRIGLVVEKKSNIKKKILEKMIYKKINNYPNYYEPKIIIFKKILLTKNGKKIRNIIKKKYDSKFL